MGEVPPPRFFDDIDDSFSYGSIRDPWRTHYSRPIENQLDVPHVPFVHHNTIGAGWAQVMDGPWVEWLDADRFRIFMHAAPRMMARPPRKPDEMPRPDTGFWLDFIFPNLWQNHLGDSSRDRHRLCARR